MKRPLIASPPWTPEEDEKMRAGALAGITRPASAEPWDAQNRLSATA